MDADRPQPRRRPPANEVRRQRQARRRPRLRARLGPPRTARRSPTPAGEPVRPRPRPRSAYNIGTRARPGDGPPELPGAARRADRRRRGRSRSRATISSREQPRAEPANTPDAGRPRELRRRMARAPGCRGGRPAGLRPAAAGLAARPAARRSTGRSRCSASTPPTPALPDDHGSPAAASAASGALLSPSAARALGVGAGDRGRAATCPAAAGRSSLPVSGIVDLSRARPLFNSREGSKLEDFLYVPDSIVVSPAAFERLVLPAFRARQRPPGATRSRSRAPPTLEVDVPLDRAPLRLRSRRRALAQTQRVARRIRRVAPGQDFCSTTPRTRSRSPGPTRPWPSGCSSSSGCRACCWRASWRPTPARSSPATQRREQAILRLRGASRAPPDPDPRLPDRGAGRAPARCWARWSGLLSMPGRPRAVRAVRGGAGALAASAAIAIGCRRGRHRSGALPAGPARPAPRGQRRAPRDGARAAAPALAALRLDYVGRRPRGAGDRRSGAERGVRRPAGAVSTGRRRRCARSCWCCRWRAGSPGRCCSVRALRGSRRAAAAAGAAALRAVVAGILARTLSRRCRRSSPGIVGVGLVVAFGSGLAIFAATYDSAKAADAEFTVGSDLRVTPSPISSRAHPASYAARLRSPASARHPGRRQPRERLHAQRASTATSRTSPRSIPPATRAPRRSPDEFFPDGRADGAGRAARGPEEILVDAETADGSEARGG